MKDLLNKFDLYSQNTKYIATFVFAALIFFIISPGTFFEIEPTGDKKVKVERKNKLATSGIHSLIFGAIMLAFYYFYLNKGCKKFGVL